MFTSTAFAQTAGAGTDFSAEIQGLLPILLAVLVFYFLVFRPQQTRAKQLKQSQAGLRRGDKIVTAGGIVGTVSKVIDDNEVEVQIAEAVKVRVIRSTISTVLARTEPTGKDNGDKAPAEASETDAAAPKKRRTTNAN
ncbi:MAG TPA: preprotein translocase subunit YajC [Aliidongia sp.]|nr:preprotein translocase subunit YajC [Aliidongia sp.]